MPVDNKRIGEVRDFQWGLMFPWGTKRRVNVQREIFVVPLILTRVSSFGTCLTTLSRSSSVKVTRTQFSSSVGRGSFPSLVTQGCSYNMVISHQYYYKNDINSSVIKIMVYTSTTTYRIINTIGISWSCYICFHKYHHKYFKCLNQEGSQSKFNLFTEPVQ